MNAQSKILFFLILISSALGSNAKASVCIMTAQLPDSSYSVWCDGQNVSEQTNASVLLQTYLSKGYKIAGQSGAEEQIVWTLTK